MDTWLIVGEEDGGEQNKAKTTLELHLELHQYLITKGC